MSIDSHTSGAQQVHREGWNLTLADSGILPPGLREAVGELAVDANRIKVGTRIRRSTHAETWLVKIRGNDLFVKIINPPGAFARLKRLFRGGPAAHVAAITAALKRDGIEVPLPMLWGFEASSGREIIVSARARGILLPRFLREAGRDTVRKRAMLHALGCDIALLHQHGYLHGDLTPYNILVAPDAPPHFVFLDHERTRKTWFARLTRPRLRNFVQLGHFNLAGLTRTDRMRVWCGYAAARGGNGARAELRRAARMIQTRMKNDARKAPSQPKQMVRRGEVGEV